MESRAPLIKSGMLSGTFNKNTAESEPKLYDMPWVTKLEESWVLSHGIREYPSLDENSRRTSLKRDTDD